MNLRVDTFKLQSLLSKAVKGSSMNKMIPLTNLMCITASHGKITLITTDATNYLYVSDDLAEITEDFSVVVMTDLFYKLISKLTCEFVELFVNDDILVVKGNGEYKIELPLNESGELIVYPNPVESIEWTKEVKIDSTDIRLMLNTAKASISITTDAECYTGYYVADKIVTTDTQVLCGIKSEIFDSPVLLFASTVDLLELTLGASTVSCSMDDNRNIKFESDNCTVYGKIMNCVDDYQIDVISDLLDQEFDSSCEVLKLAFQQVLDRVSLFVGPYDKNCVYLIFTEDGIVVKSRQSNSSEVLKCASVVNFKSFSCCIDVEMLKEQLKAYTGDMIKLEYGRDNAIKLVNDIVTQVICLQEDI